MSRAPQSLAPRASIGIRRKRQSDNMVNARVRAIYHDTGRSAPPIRQMPSSVSATSTITNKLKVFQQAELHDEYYKLVDVVTELKSACQQEQEKRVKAMSRIRRLEEIVAMKDRKIESLLHAKTVSSDHSHLVGAITQREAAQKDRQNNAMVQKLRLKISQQSQILASYEEAMQSLRSGIKSTNLMELEEERNQLYVELQHRQELLGCQGLEIESQTKKIGELFQLDASSRHQIIKLQQETKKHVLEKQKMDQEIAFLKSRVEQLQDKLVREQRKRTYDREIAGNSHANGGQHDILTSPSRNSVLASALEEMKALMKKECLASIQREKLKSPTSAASKSPKPSAGTTTSTTPTAPATPPASRPPSEAPTQPPPRQSRPQSAGPTRPHRAVQPPNGSNDAPKSSSSSSSNSSQPTRSKQSDESPTNATELHAKSGPEQEEIAILTRNAPSGTLPAPISEPGSDMEKSVSGGNAAQMEQDDGKTEVTADAVHVSLLQEEGNEAEDTRRDDASAGNGDVSACIENTVEEKEVSFEEEASVNLRNPSDESDQPSDTPREQTEGNSVDDATIVASAAEENEDEQQQRKIAEVNRMLQEMDVDVERGLLESDSSQEFLHIADLQKSLDQRQGNAEEQFPPASLFSFSPSSSEAGSSILHSLPQGFPSAAEKHERGDSELSAAEAAANLEAAGAAMAMELQALGLLETDCQVSVSVSAGSEPGPGGLLYDSDFTENDDDNEVDGDEE